MFKTNLAAIDLGTNSCRLKITDKNGKLICREATTTKLGEGMTKDMCFTPEAVERGVNCLRHYAEIMKKHDVGLYRAITTASCRMAKNGEQFVKKIYDVCVIKLEIVSAYEEALLNVRGASLNAPADKDFVLVYDLGGGSTEITLATNEYEPKILHTISIPWGARNRGTARRRQPMLTHDCPVVPGKTGRAPHDPHARDQRVSALTQHLPRHL